MNWVSCLSALAVWTAASHNLSAAAESRIDHMTVSSGAFEGNKIGVESVRDVQVFLPPSYDEGDQAYP
ncbi:MAG: hypothetical protein AAFV59_16955, partial [Pseudomonadota bacterium]